jgi:hypothetical protein
VSSRSGTHDQIFITLWQLRSCFCGRPLWQEDGSVVYNCCWSSPAQSFSHPSPMALATIFYCLRFETSLFLRLLRLAGLRWRFSTPPPHGILIRSESKSKLCYDRQLVGLSVLLSSTHLGLTTRYLLLSDRCGFVNVGHSRWRQNGSAVCNCYWSSPAHSFLGPSPAGFVTIFYCFRFETPPNWGARSPYLYPPGTGKLIRSVQLPFL